ncbi:MAG: ThuA domain-containing protein, partial [Gemmatimonadetes bacterium]|nr:ThuA domain-containing protein [Gemmatimonadota bacterium]
MTTAFALVGDRYHTSDYIRTALGRTLVQGMGLSVDFTDEITLLNAQHLSSYRLLIIFRDGMIWPNGYGIEAASV